jgi:hypothetical protein
MLAAREFARYMSLPKGSSPDPTTDKISAGDTLYNAFIRSARLEDAYEAFAEELDRIHDLLGDDDEDIHQRSL